MRYEPPTLAALAAGAGFARAELPTAVAVAVVASGGWPHADHAVGMPGCGRYVGLWGVDVDRWAEWTAAELYEPHTAAAAAYELTRLCDGFGWSAHWRAGTDRPHYGRAGIALTMAPYRDREHVAVFSDLYRDRLQDLAEHAARQRAGWAQWPIPT